MDTEAERSSAGTSQSSLFAQLRGQSLFNWTLLFFAAFLVAYLTIPILLPLTFQGTIFDARTGQVGDTFGGTVGPIVAAFGVIFTFWAFWVQFRANEQSKRDLQIERFESRLFSMLETHRNNVSEIEIHNPIWMPTKNEVGQRSETKHIEVASGRLAFLRMTSELTEIFESLKVFMQSENYARYGNPSVDERILYETSFLIFFFGLGSKIESILEDCWPNSSNHLAGPAIQHLKGERANQLKIGERNAERSFYPFNLESVGSKNNRGYVIGDGHAEWLSHYFRQVYQMVDYIDSHQANWMGNAERQQYARLIRSQLSTHEQLLLYYNAISALGEPWIKRGLLQKYGIVRSIPLPWADFYAPPIDTIGGGLGDPNFVFDWEEIRQRYRSMQESSSPQPSSMESGT